MAAPGQGAIGRSRVVEEDGPARLDLGQGYANHFETAVTAGGTFGETDIPTQVQIVIPHRNVGIVEAGAGGLAECAGRQIPIGPGRPSAADDLGGTGRSEPLPIALQEPNETID